MTILSIIAAGVIAITSVRSHEITKRSLSPLGTLDAPQLPDFLTSNPLPDGYPWGKRQAGYNNRPQDIPDTGVTRYYNFDIQRGKAAPDGYERDAILINGEFPGPTIEANWGDWIEVKVNNKITGPEEGTALHWHGFLQKETPWYDGTPSVQQCPIAPGSSFTYRFRAEVYGTTWYHAHYSAQYADGLFGALIVYGPKHIPYDVDLGPILLTDYFHKDYFTLVQSIMGSNQAEWNQDSDNTLINGRMTYNCSLAQDGRPCTSNLDLSKFRFKAGKTHLLRLINAGAAGLQKFSIDEHQMTVIANDFVPVQPYNTSVVTLGIGQRTDVLVRATGKRNDSYYMRTNQTTTPCARAKQPVGLAVILYDDAPPESKPTSTAQRYGSDGGTCKNDDLSLTVPFFPKTPEPNPDITIVVQADLITNSTGQREYKMNNSSYKANYNHPLLLLANQKNTSYPDDPQWNVYNLGNKKSIRVVVNNNNAGPHPMHIHGHDMYILHDGDGFWDGHSITNPQNPLRRDTHNLRPNGHMVMQFEADNPGVWPFHCHIAWHLSMGFSINLLERPDEISDGRIPRITAETCTDWNAYTNRTTVNQIDSGL